jgi:pantoate--beta-alanine ligase
MTRQKPALVDDIGTLRSLLDGHRADGKRVVLVPSMGALHDGHLSLVRRAAELGDIVVISIFVNPLQFGDGEDLTRYPRTLEADIAAVDGLADVVFAPSGAEMYPTGAPAIRISAGEEGERLEGASRPGHFDGMLTVVAKLLNIVQPRVAVFGQKDAQQIFLVRRMVADLDLPVTIEAGQTVRADDGLALSSRNRFLAGPERRSALALSAALRDAADAAAQGRDAALAAAAARIAGDETVRLDYLVIVDPETFLPIDAEHVGPATLLVAASVGTTRLIDNVALMVGNTDPQAP